MKYFMDLEFIEGFKKPLFGKSRHFIDLISIGIVAEDGREYYAISNEYNWNDADNWVKENVIVPMYTQEISGDRRNHIDAEHFHKCIPNGKSNKQIAQEIIQFTRPYEKKYFAPNKFQEEIEKHNIKYGDTGIGLMDLVLKYPQPEFYGYYSDYDWVVFCSLFGRMIDLPKGLPMYCIDLKQMLDEKAKSIPVAYEVEIGIKTLELQNDYPKQTNEHNALADARWNFELYKFLQKL